MLALHVEHAHSRHREHVARWALGAGCGIGDRDLGVGVRFWSQRALSIAKIVGGVDKAGIPRFARFSGRRWAAKGVRECRDVGEADKGFVQGVAIALLRPAADFGDLAASHFLAAYETWHGRPVLPHLSPGT